MSSDLVSKMHIDGLVTAAIRWPDRPMGNFNYYGADGFERVVNLATADQVGAMLWRHNMENAGWEEEAETVNAYVFEELSGEPSPLKVLRMISYYSYQTVGDEWTISEPFAFLRYLQEAAIHRLPGMDDLPWGLDNPNVSTAAPGE